MQTLHVKNLAEYHPGYTERNLIWCKLYFKTISGDPDFEMLEEIDQWRFIKFVILELQSKKPVPLIESYLQRKGFDFKKRSMSLTVKALEAFIEVRNADLKECVTQVPVVVDTSTSSSISFSSSKKKDIPNDILEAVEYFSVLGSNSEAANKFHDYYSSKGWVVGRHSMKDWKAAARNWVRNDRDRKPSSQSRLKNRAEEIAKEIAHL